MALSDITATVIVGKSEYEQLIRKAEQIEVIKNIVQYPVANVNLIRSILCVEVEDAGEPYPEPPKHVNCRCTIHGLPEEDFIKYFFGKESEE